MIRAACAADLAAIVALERAAGTAPHWGEEVYRGMLLDEARCLLVEEDAGVIRGFAVGLAVAGEGEMESVVVEAGARGRGLGFALCEDVVRWCAGRGAGVVRLEVRAGSAGVIRLYERLGFEVVGRRRGYYAEPEEDAVLMEKVLARRL